MALRIVATRPNPALVTLPWHLPLEEWGDDVVVQLPRGLSRHVVRIVRLGQDVYAVKETRESWAFREYRLLRDLRRLGLPTVEPVGVVAGRASHAGEEIEPCLVTRHLQFSLPYRALFSQDLLKGLEVSASIYNRLDKHYDDPASSQHRQELIGQDGRTFRGEA